MVFAFDGECLEEGWGFRKVRRGGTIVSVGACWSRVARIFRAFTLGIPGMCALVEEFNGIISECFSRWGGVAPQEP